MATQTVEQQIQSLKTEVAAKQKQITELTEHLVKYSEMVEYVNASIKSKIDTLAVSIKSSDTTWTSGTLHGSTFSPSSSSSSPPSSTIDFNPGKCSCCS
jgi:uncharacterized coiled-coil protein SlyX